MIKSNFWAKAMSFIDHFETLEDTRSHINQKHELLDVIFLTVVAILSGAEGWKDIKQFGDNKLIGYVNSESSSSSFLSMFICLS